MSDDARSTAFNHAAPDNERVEALSGLQKAHMPSASAMIPRADIQPIIDVINEGLMDGAMLKARGGNILTFPDARGGYGTGPEPKKKRGMQSLYIDDLQVFASGEYFEKPSALNFDALRQMCDQTPILSAIIQTRIRQVGRFCNPSEDGGPGFEIRHVDRKHILTSQEEMVTDLLNKFIMHCGWEFNARARKRLRRDTFSGFMAKSIRDSMSMDSAPIETEMKTDRTLGLDGFYAVDGATIRLCHEQGYDGNDEIYALQVVDGRITTAYTLDQLVYEPRNPRADVRLSGYGYAEPEMLVRCVTGFLNAMTYNSKGFDSNSIPKGLLHLSGDYSQEDLVAFKRFWNSMVKGVNQAWTLPVLVSKDQESKASFENFGVEFSEMHFSKWMTFLTSMVCAIYGMDPGEINFESFAADKSSLSGSDTSAKLDASKDKGLRPFLAYYESLISDYILGEWEQYCFRWVGLDEENPEQAWEGDKLVLTVNELRAAKGYQPYPTDDDGPDLGAAPLNPALMAAWQQATMPEQGEEFGGPAAEGEDFGTVDGEGDPQGGGGDQKPGMPPQSAEPQRPAEPPEETGLAKARIWSI